MHREDQTDSLKALNDIKGIMERSSRFLSLSGWSGIWAGCTALAGAAVAYFNFPLALSKYYFDHNSTDGYTAEVYRGDDRYYPMLMLLAVAIFIVAFIGAYYFTWRKARHQGGSLWNHASRQMLWALAVPLLVGGIFALGFIYYGHPIFVAPACLAFYGLALVNGSKFTHSDIKYLGYLELLLGCICLFVPGWGIYFWAAGFGLLHILYGIIMWNKYDKQLN